VTAREPELEIVRRVMPIILPIASVAFLVASLVSNVGAGVSAALGILVVGANLAASGISLAWAAGISEVAIFAVGLGGFVLRIALFVILLLVLKTYAWFSAAWFAGAFVPATIGLLGFEMRYMARRKVQANLWYFREQPK
jgi:hypothetical protein